MLSLFFSCSFSLPQITKAVYFDLAIQKKRIGRIEFGLCGNACPKEVNTIMRGVECKDFCYRGTNLSDYTIGESFAIGSSFNSKGDGNDPITGDNKQAYLICSAASNGKATGKFYITLRANHELDKSLNPIGKLLSGQKVIQKIMEYAGQEEDKVDNVKITGCGVLSNFEDDDLDL